MTIKIKAKAKADELLRMVEQEEVGVLEAVVKDDRYYDAFRQKVSNDYLTDVGGVSKYINDTLGEMIKNNSVRGK